MEYSRRAVEKLAKRKGVHVHDTGQICHLDGEIISCLDPEACASRPEFWKALAGRLQEIPDSAEDKPAVIESKDPKRQQPPKYDKPGYLPPSGTFSRSGFCAFPGIDDHGHALCSKQQGTGGCVCPCHKGEQS